VPPKSKNREKRTKFVQPKAAAPICSNNRASITIAAGTAAGGWRAGVWSLNAEAGVEGY